jgi:hypothetical protein
MAAPSTTSTSLPTCNYLQVTSIRLKPRKNNPSKARLSVRGVLADAGWADADPRLSGVNLGLIASAGRPDCCTVEQEFWMEPRRTQFDFWDKRRGICPPLNDMRITVRRRGRAAFEFRAPLVDLTAGMPEDLTLEVIIGNHCSIGGLPFTALRRQGGALVYP